VEHDRQSPGGRDSGELEVDDAIIPVEARGELAIDDA